MGLLFEQIRLMAAQIIQDFFFLLFGQRAVYPGQAVMPGSVTRMYAGTPTTVTAGADKVTGLTDARDLWTPETVPNAGNWSPAAAYPVK